MKVEYFTIKTWYISKRNMELFQNQSCQALGWLRTLYTGSAKNIKFEILGSLEALEDYK